MITWTIAQCDRRTSDGFINVAHWRCTGADGDITSSVYATCSFADGTPTIPYADVTEAEVLDWIWANGVDKDATEAAVAAQIEAQKNPVEASGVPWGAKDESPKADAKVGDTWTIPALNDPAAIIDPTGADVTWKVDWGSSTIVVDKAGTWTLRVWSNDANDFVDHSKWVVA